MKPMHPNEIRRIVERRNKRLAAKPALPTLAAGERHDERAERLERMAEAGVMPGPDDEIDAAGP